MCVGDEHKVEHGGVNGQLLIYKNILTLLHTAVNDALFVTDFNQRAASCYLVCRT